MKNRVIRCILGFHEKGFSNKIISLIFNVTQPYVSKIVNKKLHKDETAYIKLTYEELLKYRIINNLLHTPKLLYDNQKNNTRFILLLKYLMVDKELIRQSNFIHLSKRLFEMMYINKDEDFLDIDLESIEWGEKLQSVDKELIKSTFIKIFAKK